MSQFQPEEQQMQICLLKSSLKDIEDNLVSQNSVLPDLDAENKLKSNIAMSLLRSVRTLNAEVDRLNMENVKKTAIRIQLKNQCDDLNKNLEHIRSIRAQLVNSIKQEENDLELLIKKYEDSLKQRADRFRQTRSYYNEEEMKVIVNEELKKISELENLREMQLNAVEYLKKKLDDVKPNVPNNILSILGKSQIDVKINELTKKFEALMKEC
ncbi:hypothetical protein K1T71_001277 [Dendrolimus kikuchii]|uniref:Uncharacterized protein n=1 Tax=Dendrolimus kikuchii TaxID=765133 RepID=A0ACC1DIV0_9NEOP|nr:hypothetical protein K1T71_001277 [Dendrolimus kikuchii]